MKQAHKISIRAFVKPEDIEKDPSIEKKVNDAMIKLTTLPPEEREKHKIGIVTEKAEGFNNRIILIKELTLTKESHTNIFLKALLERLNPDQKELLWRQAESRLDEGLDFFIRLGKEELLRDDIYITDSGDCLHIRIGLAAFPKKREAALKLLESILIQ